MEPVSAKIVQFGYSKWIAKIAYIVVLHSAYQYCAGPSGIELDQVQNHQSPPFVRTLILVRVGLRG